MRTTRRRPNQLLPLLQSYGQHHLCDLTSLTRTPVFGRRVDAIVRARAVWFHREFIITSTDADLRHWLQSFHESVMPVSLAGPSIARNLDRIRAALTHVLESRDGIALRLNRCLAGAGVFAVPGLGPMFWSAVAQALDPLRNPSWTPLAVRAARRLGLIRRRKFWYGDLMTACEQIRERDPRLTAIHVDHFLSLAAACPGRDLSSAVLPPDPIPALIAEERAARPLQERLSDHSTRIAAARRALTAALAAEDGPAALDALASIDARLGDTIRAWDASALLQWIAWIWNDDDPLAEVAACERESAGAGRCLTSAVLHLRHPDRFPLWDRSAAAGLARIADGGADDYRHYVESLTMLCQQYGLHRIEAPGVLGRLAAPETR